MFMSWSCLFPLSVIPMPMGITLEHCGMCGVFLKIAICMIFLKTKYVQWYHTYNIIVIHKIILHKHALQHLDIKRTDRTEALFIM